MQPRPIAMPVRQSATRDKSPPPSASSPAPSLTPKASAVASTSEPATAAVSTKPKRKRKKKAEPTTDRRPKPRTRDEGDATTAETATPEPVGVMVMDAGATASRPYRGKCLYQSRKCENERALKRNGLPHNLCEEHRSKQNQHQRKFDAKKFSRKRRSDTDGEHEGDDGEESALHDKKHPRVSAHQQQRQHLQPVTTSNSVVISSRAVNFAPIAAGVAPPLVSLAASPAHALYAGSVAPIANSFRVGTSPSLGHSIASQPSIPIPGVTHQEYQRMHTQPSPTQQHLPQQQYAGRPATGYSLSELEAARILVPTSMAKPSGTPPAYTDARTPYQQPHPYQQPQHQEYYQHQQPVIKIAASMPTAGTDRPQGSMTFRPQVDIRPADPSPRVLPPLLRPPPMPTFPHVDTQRPHSFAPGISTSTAPSMTLRSPLLTATSAPLPTVPRLSSLGSAPLPPTTGDVLPSLAPFRLRRSPLRPATSQ